MEPNPPAARRAWRVESDTPSLPEVNRSIQIPQSLGFWRKMLAFAGPGGWSMDNAIGLSYTGAGWGLVAISVGLIVGVVVSFFTAVFVTQLLLHGAIEYASLRRRRLWGVEERPTEGRGPTDGRDGRVTARGTA